MKPWMSDFDTKAIEEAIFFINGSINILEWGSGGSTQHFTEFLAKNNKSFSWISLEYNKKWYEKVSSLGLKNTKIILFDSGNDRLKQKMTNMDEYVDFPLSLNKKFDLILVDGRKRRRCLINASKIIKKDGLVFLHDAQRKYYHCSFKYFSKHNFISKTLWCGYV